MLKNYFKTALRFLRNNKTFSLINIIGLSLGTVSFHTLKAANANPIRSLRSE